MSSDAGELPTRSIVRTLEICNKKGLHARASAKFVQTVERFDAKVLVTRGQETVGGDSIMGLMMAWISHSILRPLWMTRSQKRPSAFMLPLASEPTK